MNAKFLFVALLAASFLIVSCQRPLIVNDDDLDGGAKWELVDSTSETAIKVLHATDFELYVMTENSFTRLNSDLNIIEKRVFPISNSTPAVSDNTFVRLTTNNQGRQVIEFHLAHSGSEIFKVLTDTLPTPPGNSLDVDVLANSLGAFSSDGTLFLMAAKVLPARYYSLYLFNVQQNFQTTAFTSVKMIKRIDLPDLDANAEGRIKSMRFAGGNFYVASQQGAWRITPAGVAAKKFEQWKEDCFEWLGDLYMTGTVDYDLDKSIDNGLAWERVNVGSDLRYVTVADTVIFTQEVPGKFYQVMPKDFKKAKSFVYPSKVSLESSLFFGLVYYNDRYYLAADKAIYATDKIKLE